MVVTLDSKSQWLENVRRVPSPNCDARPPGAGVQLLVIHGISLPPGEFGSSHVDRLFTNTLDPAAHPYFEQVGAATVSAHLLIDRTGRITQYVPFDKRAWHAGPSEFNGRRNCNDFSIGIELEGADNIAYEQAQYRVLADVVRALRQAWPGLDEDAIRGHCHIAPGRKTDPGPAFEWGRLHGLLNGEGETV